MGVDTLAANASRTATISSGLLVVSERETLIHSLVMKAFSTHSLCSAAYNLVVKKSSVALMASSGLQGPVC
jgi:hypothetical protein